MTRDQLWQEGEYEATPTGIIYTESPKTGSPCMEVSFDVGGHPRTVRMWLSEKAEASTMARLGELGFNGDFAAPAITRTEPVKLTMKHAEYEGKWKEEWTYWGTRAVQLAKDKAAALNAKYRATNGPVPRPAGKPTPPPAASPKPAAPSAPPRPGAAVKPAPPAPVGVVARNADEAWAYWVKQTADVDGVDREEKYTQALNQFGVPEDQLTAAQWNQVALAADVPF